MWNLCSHPLCRQYVLDIFVTLTFRMGVPSAGLFLALCAVFVKRTACSPARAYVWAAQSDGSLQFFSPLAINTTQVGWQAVPMPDVGVTNLTATAGTATPGLWGSSPEKHNVFARSLTQREPAGNDWVLTNCSYLNVNITTSALQVAGGGRGLWGISPEGKVVYRDESCSLRTSWTVVDDMDGELGQAVPVRLTVCPGGDHHPSTGAVEDQGDVVLAIDTLGTVYRRRGIAFDTPIGTKWDRLPGVMSEVTCGPCGSVWGVPKSQAVPIEGEDTDETFQVVYGHPDLETPAGVLQWEPMGLMARSVAGSKAAIVVADTSGVVWYREGIDCSNDTFSMGVGWTHLTSGGLMPPDTVSVIVSDMVPVLNESLFGADTFPTANTTKDVPVLQGSLLPADGWQLYGGVEQDGFVSAVTVGEPANDMLARCLHRSTMVHVANPTTGTNYSFCYLNPEGNLTHAEAVDHCSSQGLQLVEVTDDDKAAAINTVASYDYTWLGMMCRSSSATACQSSATEWIWTADRRDVSTTYSAFNESTGFYPISYNVTTGKTLKCAKWVYNGSMHADNNGTDTPLWEAVNCAQSAPIGALCEQPVIDSADYRVGKIRICLLSGRIRAMSMPWKDTAFTLPEPCRPRQTSYFVANNIDSSIVVEVSTTGKAKVLPKLGRGGDRGRHGFISLEGIPFVPASVDQRTGAPLELLWSSGPGANVTRDTPMLAGKSSMPPVSSVRSYRWVSGMCVLGGRVFSKWDEDTGGPMSTTEIGTITDEVCIPAVNTNRKMVATSSGAMEIWIGAAGVISLIGLDIDCTHETLPCTGLPEWVSLDGVVYATITGKADIHVPSEMPTGLSREVTNPGSVTLRRAAGGWCILTGLMPAVAGGPDSVLAQLPSYCRPTATRTLSITVSLDRSQHSPLTRARFGPSNRLFSQVIAPDNVVAAATLAPSGKIRLLTNMAAARAVLAGLPSNSSVANVQLAANTPTNIMISFDSIIDPALSRPSTDDNGVAISEDAEEGEEAEEAVEATSTAVGVRPLLKHLAPAQFPLTVGAGWGVPPTMVGYRGPVVEVTPDGSCLMGGVVGGGDCMDPIAGLPPECWPKHMPSIFMAQTSLDAPIAITATQHGTLTCDPSVPLGGDDWISLSSVFYHPSVMAAAVKAPPSPAPKKRGNRTVAIFSDPINDPPVASRVASTVSLSGSYAAPAPGVLGLLPVGSRPAQNLVFVQIQTSRSSPKKKGRSGGHRKGGTKEVALETSHDDSSLRPVAVKVSASGSLRLLEGPKTPYRLPLAPPANVSLNGIVFETSGGSAGAPIVAASGWETAIAANLAGGAAFASVVEGGRLCVLRGALVGTPARGIVGTVPLACRPSDGRRIVTVGAISLNGPASTGTTIGGGVWQGRLDITSDGSLELHGLSPGTSAAAKATWNTGTVALILSGIAYDPRTSSSVLASLQRATPSHRARHGSTSVAFDGSASVTAVLHTGRLPPTFTVEMWVSFESAVKSGEAPAAVLVEMNNAISVKLDRLNKPMVFADTGAHKGLQSKWVSGEWYHIAVTGSTHSLTMLVNGVIDRNMSRHSPKGCVDVEGKGGDYRGAITTTQKNLPCLHWSTFDHGMDAFDNNLVGSRCRNPGGERPAPWCYTGMRDPNSTSDDHATLYDDVGKYQLCDIPTCGGNPDEGMTIGAGLIGRLAEVRVWGAQHTPTTISELMHLRVSSWATELLLDLAFLTPRGVTADEAGNSIDIWSTGNPLWVRGGPLLTHADDLDDETAPSCVDSSTGRIRVRDMASLTYGASDPITIELWFNAHRTASIRTWLLLKGGQYGIAWGGHGNPLGYYDGDLSHTGVRRNFLADSWYHVAMVDSGVVDEGVSLYIDGRLDSVEPRGLHRLNPNSLSVGGAPGGPYFQGRISDVRLWRSARSQSQITRNMMHRLNGVEGGLILNLQMRTGTTIAYDVVSGTEVGLPKGSVWQQAGPYLVPSAPVPPSPDRDKVMTYRRSSNPWVKPDVSSSLSIGMHGAEDVDEESTAMALYINYTWCPGNCSGRGVCTQPEGVCECDAGYTGEDCGDGCPVWCNDHGVCVDNTCFCEAGYRGDDCGDRKSLSWDVRNTQCARLPKRMPHFCSMIDHPVAAIIVADVEAADARAEHVYRHLSKYCPHSGLGRQTLKHAVCASFFLKCGDDGVPVGVCADSCRAYSELCQFPEPVCEHSMYVTDPDLPCEPIPMPVAETCARNCTSEKQGWCEEGLCQCNEGYAHSDCSGYDGDVCTANKKGRDFCDMVDYAVPEVVNAQWSDITARKAYAVLEPFCPAEDHVALSMMKRTLCATTFVKCDQGRVLKPCRSLCLDYAERCNISTGLSCFGEFYADAPNCFEIPPTMTMQPWEMHELMKKQAQERLWASLRCNFNFSCHGNGDCREDGTCLCSRGWQGYDCAIEIPTCDNYCSGHGICQGRMCKCLPGWRGESCDKQTSLCDFDCARDGWRVESCCATVQELLHPSTVAATYVKPRCNCGPHGQCVGTPSNATCVCTPGWTGHNCSKISPCTNGCSGHGVCHIPPAVEVPFNTTDRYQADGNYSSATPTPMPSKPEYATVLNATSAVAPYFENETTIVSDWTPPEFVIVQPTSYCTCEPNFRGSDDCSKPTTPLHMCADMCNHNGYCVAHRVLMPVHPKGSAAATPPVQLAATEQVPGGSNATNGTAIARRRNFSNASVPAIVGGQRVAYNWTMQYDCVCDKAWEGGRCQRPKPCMNNCSNRVERSEWKTGGECVLGECQCIMGRTGRDCSRIVRWCDVHFDCMNGGLCNREKGQCECPRFFFGSDCAKRIANPVCGKDFECENNGLCKDGRCLCLLGFFGYNCGGIFTHDSHSEQPNKQFKQFNLKIGPPTSLPKKEIKVAQVSALGMDD